MSNMSGRMPTRGNPLKIPQIVEVQSGEVTDKNFAQKITIVGDILYFGSAEVGSLQGDPVWQCKKVDTTGGNILITWADGDANFDNIATDLTALTYA